LAVEILRIDFTNDLILKGVIMEKSEK